MKTRIISAAVAIVLLIIILIFRSTPVLSIAFSLINLIAMYEALVNTKLCKAKAPMIVCIAYAAIVPFFIYFQKYALMISVLFLFAYFFSVMIQKQQIPAEKMAYAPFITAYVSLSLYTLILLEHLPDGTNYAHYRRIDGLFFILLALLGAWIGDTGAYFVGSAFGKHKLAPSISPKKTIEGAIGGVLTTVIVFVLFGLFWDKAICADNQSVRLLLMIPLAILCSIGGMVGDLMFSYIKRSVGIKDFGNIMPGHGGALDRFDSVSLVAPFVYAYVTLFPVIVIS